MLYEELYNEYEKRIKVATFKIARDNQCLQHWEDIQQEVYSQLLVIHKNYEKLLVKNASFKTFLDHSVKNIAYNYYRDKVLHTTFEDFVFSFADEEKAPIQIEDETQALETIEFFETFMVFLQKLDAEDSFLLQYRFAHENAKLVECVQALGTQFSNARCKNPKSVLIRLRKLSLQFKNFVNGDCLVA
jgi:RNA polymerase sigma factor (sigma-70 family)